MTIIFVLLILSLNACVASATGCGWEIKPMLDLPAHIEADEGEVSLIADFDAAQPRGIPVYLVNRTSRILILRKECEDAYVMLEALIDGEWVRAERQPNNWMNHPETSPPIPAGHYLKVEGYDPTSGSEHLVRFAIYNQEIEATSDSDWGLAIDWEIEAARRDVLSVYEGSLKYVASVATRQLILGFESDLVPDLQRAAIRTLAQPRFVREDALAVLADVYLEFPNLRRLVEKVRLEIGD